MRLKQDQLMNGKSPVLAHLASARPSRDLLPDLEERVGTETGRSLLDDGLQFITFGASAIAQDDFSKCFQPEPRTRFSLENLFAPFYMTGFLFRYCFLFPYRLCLLLTASVVFFMLLPVVLFFHNEDWQTWLFMFYCNAFLRSFGAQISYHGEKPKLKRPHIFAANHTSLIDYIVLSANDFPHAVIAQSHGGILGFFLKSVLALNGSLIFDRAAKHDRTYVPLKMKQHTRELSRSPLLIFPEGTCVNNEYTVLFHKGAFELDAAVCPVAIKYNKKWALVADVWYLTPEDRREGESAVEFANRVKALISKQAKLKNLSWDGYFKHFGPPKEKQDRLKENPQTRYGAILLHRLRQPDGPTTDRLGRMRRSNSIALGEVPTLRKVSAAPEWLLGGESTQKGNEILVALEDSHRRTDMIQAIETRKSDVVHVWRQYATLRTATETRTRVEYSSWRVWFKQRIERDRRRQDENEECEPPKTSPSEGWLDYLTEAASTATVVLRRNLPSKSFTDLTSLAMGGSLGMTSTSTNMSHGHTSIIRSNAKVAGRRRRRRRASISAFPEISLKRKAIIIDKSSDEAFDETAFCHGKRCNNAKDVNGTRSSATSSLYLGEATASAPVHLSDEWAADKPVIIAAN
ncbi:hypothetical protein SeLEV6574_g02393 [Synchytrium endobioticum]|nr:hypothetical protein SeLEV6574_g02393 [Synchytrium endobioticum]